MYFKRENLLSNGVINYGSSISYNFCRNVFILRIQTKFKLLHTSDIPNPTLSKIGFNFIFFIGFENILEAVLPYYFIFMRLFWTSSNFSKLHRNCFYNSFVLGILTIVTASACGCTAMDDKSEVWAFSGSYHWEQMNCQTEVTSTLLRCQLANFEHGQFVRF